MKVIGIWNQNATATIYSKFMKFEETGKITKKTTCYTANLLCGISKGF